MQCCHSVSNMKFLVILFVVVTCSSQCASSSLQRNNENSTITDVTISTPSLNSSTVFPTEGTINMTTDDQIDTMENNQTKNKSTNPSYNETVDELKIGTLPNNKKINFTNTLTVNEAKKGLEKYYISDNLYILRSNTKSPDVAKTHRKSFSIKNTKVTKIQPSSEINRLQNISRHNINDSKIIRIEFDNALHNLKVKQEHNKTGFIKTKPKILKLNLIDKSKNKSIFTNKETDPSENGKTLSKTNYVNPYRQYLLRSDNINQTNQRNNYIRRKKEAHHQGGILKDRFHSTDVPLDHPSLGGDDFEDLSDLIPGVYYHDRDPHTGGYHFKYNTGTHWRQEKRTPDGVVRGSYGWRDAVGRNHITRYIADAAGYRVISPGDQVPTYVTAPPNFQEQSNILISSNHVDQTQFGDKNIHFPQYQNTISQQTDSTINNIPKPIDIFNLPSHNVYQNLLQKIPSISFEDGINTFDKPLTGRPPIAYPLPNTPETSSQWSYNHQSSSWSLNPTGHSNINAPTQFNPYLPNKDPTLQSIVTLPFNQYHNFVPNIFPQGGNVQFTYPPGHVYSIIATKHPWYYYPTQHTNTYQPTKVHYLNNNPDYYPFEAVYNPYQHQSQYFNNQHQHWSQNQHINKNPNDIYSLPPLKQQNYFQSDNPAGVMAEHLNNLHFLNNTYIHDNPFQQKPLKQEQTPFLNNLLNNLNGANLTFVKDPANSNSEYVIESVKPWSSSVIKLPGRPNYQSYIPTHHHATTESLDYDFLSDDIQDSYEIKDDPPPRSIQDILASLLNDLDKNKSIVKPHPLKPTRLGIDLLKDDNKQGNYIGSIKWKLPVLGTNEELGYGQQHIHKTWGQEGLLNSKPLHKDKHNTIVHKDILNDDKPLNEIKTDSLFHGSTLDSPPLPFLFQKLSATTTSSVDKTVSTWQSLMPTDVSIPSTTPQSTLPFPTAGNFLKQLLDTLMTNNKN